MFVVFFSSRRRHTRLQGDWSSDVCSSDLRGIGTPEGSFAIGGYTFSTYRLVLFGCAVAVLAGLYIIFMKRSEERRVGKECSNGWRSPKLRARCNKCC